MVKATLAADHITKRFEQGGSVLSVFNDITICFDQGHTYGITGISGAGKSTFMHIIANLDTPTTGNVLFNAYPLRSFSSAQQAHFLRFSVGLVFQLPYLMRELSVVENVMIPGLLAGRDKKECYAHACNLIEKVGVESKIHCKPGELSGGQQQRIAIARALMNQPAFLIADEPTGHLDLKTGQSIIDLLRTCRDEWGMGIIISSHDDYVSNAMQQVYEMSEGSLKKIK